MVFRILLLVLLVSSLPSVSGAAANPPAASPAAAYRATFFTSTPDHWLTLPHIEGRSRWLEADRETHRGLSRGQRYDVLVLPAQQWRISEDRVSRLLAARRLATEIRARTGAAVMPVELAQRLLGERCFRFSDGDVRQLAADYGASTVVHVYLGHREDLLTPGRLGILVEKDGKRAGSAEYRLATRPHEVPLDVAARAITARAVGELFPDATPGTDRAIAGASDDAGIPETLDALLEAGDDPLRHALHLQLLAMLTSSNVEFERRRLFERSLVALDAVDPAAGMHRVLRARALHYLYRRPAARALLARADTPAEFALRDYLDGNYPALRERLATIDAPLLRLFAYLELAALRESYQRKEEPLPPLPLPGSAWSRLVENVTSDGDSWYVPSLLAMAQEMRGLFAEFDRGMMLELGGQMVAGELSGDVAADMLYERVWQRIVTALPADGCCRFADDRVTRLDLLRFYRNLGVAGMARSLRKVVVLQNLPQPGLALADRLEPAYGGHVLLARYRAQVLVDIAARSRGSERKNLLVQAFAASDLAIAQAGGTEAAAVQASYQRSRIAGMDESVFRFDRYNSESVRWYGRDHPSVWLLDEIYQLPGGLRYSVDAFEIIRREAAQPGKHSGVHYPAGEIDLESEALARFDGHPDKLVYRVERQLADDDREAAMELLRGEVERGTTLWNAYILLGRLYVESERHDEASEVLARYPPFTEEAPANRLRVANNAGLAASLLFWQSGTERARPFLEISARQRTGSAMEYRSAERLAQLDGRYTEAAGIALAAGKRYGQPRELGKYLAYLHAFGLAEQAEAGFRQLAPRFQAPELWTALFVGQRIAGMDLSAVREWLLSFRAEAAQPGLRTLADHYMYLQAVVDRPLPYDGIAVAAGSPSVPRPASGPGTPLAEVAA